MTGIIFKCLQCGRCCKSLFKEDKEGLLQAGLLGLSLFPDERRLFPKKLVSPHTGIGWGTEGPKHVIRYQLNVNVCPHLANNNLCKLYSRRPLICQAFPLISVGDAGTTIANPSDCSFVEDVERKIGSLDSMLPMTPKKFKSPKEWQAIANLNGQREKLLAKHIIHARVEWKFDLRNNQWNIMSAR